MFGMVLKLILAYFLFFSNDFMNIFFVNIRLIILIGLLWTDKQHNFIGLSDSTNFIAKCLFDFNWKWLKTDRSL